MKQLAFLFLTLLLSAAVPALAQTKASAEDEAAIRATALNYVEGWYEGNAARMEEALHPDLAKRMAHEANSHTRLEQMSAMGLVQMTRAGYGKKVPPAQQIKNIVILDVFGNAASVRAEMSGWIDYMHMAKFDGKWKIVNVLWELKPQKK
jgi:hypothetical protein